MLTEKKKKQLSQRMLYDNCFMAFRSKSPAELPEIKKFWHKLKDAVYNFALEIEDKFTEVNNKTKDPEFADYILNEMIEESVPKKKPGRPSNQDLKELKQQQEAEKGSFRNILSLVQLLAAGSSMTCQGLKLFSRPNPNVTTQTIADADMFLDWLNYER
ncbi:hypothetical protein [Paenibacillus sp. TY11]|uniref:hypothetical protein n=1 Tax=Paenibacillus sp. TY11 TaxID=3448633 RepID=UPI00403984EF